MSATLAVAVLLSFAAAEPTTIFLVRHAEKVVEPKVDDPLLTPAGSKRAEALAKVLGTSGVKAIYATEYKRTQLTVAPLAARAKVDVKTLSSKDSKAFAKTLLEKHPGQTIVVAGHSNTIPDLIKELGVTDKVEIGDADYDNLFIVIRREGQAPQLIRLHYGD